MREKLIKIYQDTKDICSNIKPPISEKICWGEDTPQAGVDFDVIYHHGNIIVEPMDTVSALVKYSKIGKTAILNMASSKRKGGGVENGSVAQEECIFRCSNLFTISDSFYPIRDNEYIYTKDATFVKDFGYIPMEHIKCDVITIPAPNLNSYYQNGDKRKDVYKISNQDNYEADILDRMFYMINSAAIGGCDNIILGAWGCGVFKNDPKLISELFKETLYGSEIYKHFKNVVFAIINDSNSVGNNYQIFKETFN
jgi:uncharacterized protein (TIGR02452 family)